MWRISFGLLLVACGARTELGAGGGDAAAVMDAHADDVHDAHPGIDAPNCTFPDLTGTIRVTTDDEYLLYVNDALVDPTTHAWTDAQEYSVTIHRNPSARNTIAVQGTNQQNTDGRDRGVVLDLRFTTEAGEQTIVTSSEWRLTMSLQPNWFGTTVDDSSWPKAVSEGPYGEGPWLTVFSKFGIDSQAEWIWSYDSNQPSNAKVVQETVYVRRDFYIDAGGHVTNAASGCK